MARTSPGTATSITVGSIALQDGDDSGLKVDVLDLTSNNALAVAVVDGSGNQITSFGGGTQYSDGDVNADPTGTVAMGTDGSNIYALHTDTSGDLQVDILNASLAVTGTFWQATQPVSLASVPSHAVTNAGTFAVQVDGTALTALQNIDTDATTIIGHVDSIEGLLTTIDGDTGNIVTSVQLIDDTIFTAGTDTYTEATSKGQLMLGVRRDADTTLANTTNEFVPFQVDANGYLKVEVFSGATLPVSLTSTTVTGTVAVTQSGTWDEVGINDSGNSITVDNAQLSVVGTGTEAAAMRVTIATDSTGVLSVDDNGGILTVDGTVILGAGTAEIGKLAAGVANIGDVDVLTIAAGDNNIGNVDIVSGTITTVSALGVSTTGPQKAEDVAHVSGDMGIFALGVRQDTPNATAAASNDYHYLATDMVGGLRTALYETDFAVLGTNHVKKYYTSAGAATDGIIWSSAAGKRWYVTDIFINVSAAATVTLEDDLVAGDSPVWKAELAANSGWSHHFGTPLFSGEDAADLLITTSAGNVYVTVTGYEI
ncbi:MAG: hypothetical protein AAB922_01205 [Patescibacteria group bacterium]